PPTVCFALLYLKILETAKRLSAESGAEHIKPSLGARQKSTVLTALKLLAKAAQDKPGIKGKAAHVATTALSHEAAEVQAAALDFLERYGDTTDAALVALVQEKAGFVAASQRVRLTSWLGNKADGATDEVQPRLDLKALLKRATQLDKDMARQAGIDVAIAVIGEESCDITALEFDGTEFPRLDPAKAIVPIQDLDELIDCFAAALENPSALDE